MGQTTCVTLFTNEASSGVACDDWSSTVLQSSMAVWRGVEEHSLTT